MTPDAVNDLIVKALIVAMKVAGPALLVTLLVGLVIGVLQAATQINEAKNTKSVAPSTQRVC